MMMISVPEHVVTEPMQLCEAGEGPAPLQALLVPTAKAKQKTGNG
jgi:hypothetical protein